MRQLSLYLQDEIAAKSNDRAVAIGRSTSQYPAALVEQHLENEWPLGHLEQVFGDWVSEQLKSSAV